MPQKPHVFALAHYVHTTEFACIYTSLAIGAHVCVCVCKCDDDFTRWVCVCVWLCVSRGCFSAVCMFTPPHLTLTSILYTMYDIVAYFTLCMHYVHYARAVRHIIYAVFLYVHQPHSCRRLCCSRQQLTDTSPVRD